MTRMRLTATILALAAAAPAASACTLPLGPMAGIVRWEYDADRATCRHHGLDRLRCTIESDELLDGDPRFPMTVSTWVRVDWARGVLRGDLEPHAQGFDLSWTYRWPCAPARAHR